MILAMDRDNDRNIRVVTQQSMRLSNDNGKLL